MRCLLLRVTLSQPILQYLLATLLLDAETEYHLCEMLNLVGSDRVPAVLNQSVIFDIAGNLASLERFRCTDAMLASSADTLSANTAVPSCNPFAECRNGIHLCEMLNLVGFDRVPAVLNQSLILDIAGNLASLPLVEEELFVPYYQPSSIALVSQKVFRSPSSNFRYL